MHHCLFCGKELKPEDVLFGMRVKNEGQHGPDHNKGKNEGQHGLDHGREDEAKRGSTSPFLNSGEKGGSETCTETDRERSVEDADLGRWVPDKTYDTFLKKYLYMNFKSVYDEQIIFAVRWSHEEACHGQGKAVKMGKNKRLPLDVELCAEDAKASGYEFLTKCFCPYCHCEIMQGFFDTPEERIHNIAFVGGSRAGKTQYITAVYQNLSASMLSRYYRMGYVEFDSLSKSIMTFLSNTLSGNLSMGDAVNAMEANAKASASGDTVDPKKDASEASASEDAQSGRGTMKATERKPILPIVMKITRDSRTDITEDTRDDGTSKKTDVSFIALYDCPGEIFRSQNEYELPNNKGLRLANSLLFLADSAQLFQPLLYDAERDKAVKEDTCMLDLAEMLYHLRDRFGDSEFKAISFVVTKIDKVIDGNVCGLSRVNLGSRTLPKVLQSKDYLDHRDAVDLNVIEIIDNTMRDALGEDDGQHNTQWDEKLALLGVINRLEECFARCDRDNIKVFAVSTFSRSNDNSRFEICGEPSMNRHRLLEPLLYLLAKLDVLPSTTLGKDEPEPEPVHKRGFFSRIFG